MPDIAMCANTGCPSRHECHRYCAHPSLVQSWFNWNVEPKRKACDHWLPRKPTDRTGNEADAAHKARGTQR